MRRTTTGRPVAIVLMSALIGFAFALVASPGAAVTKRTKSAGSTVAATPRAAALPKPSNVTLRTGPMLDVGKDLAGGRPVLRQGPLSEFAGQLAVASGAKPMTFGQLAEIGLASPRTRRDHLVGARAGLLADPVMTEEVIETDQANVLVSTTSFTVVNPALVRASAPEVMKRTPTGKTAANLNATQRKAFDAFKASLALKPNGHPLKEAMANGDDALAAAIAEGKGDQTITTRIRIEKQAPPVAGISVAQNRSGHIEAATSVGATKAPANARTTKTKKVAKFRSSAVTVPKGAPSGAHTGATVTTKKSGAAPPATVTCCDVNAKLETLAGFTVGDDIGWDETVNVGIGEFTVGAVAEYSVGLRVPLRVTGNMTPSVMANTINNTGDHAFDVTLTAETFDASADYYRNVGIAANDIKDGKELVVFGDVYVFIEGNILGIPFDGRFPEKPLLDFGQNFTPPYGACAPSCGFDVWVPASLTHTSINILGIVSGSGQIGFNVSGAGTVGVTYDSTVDGAIVPASKGAGSPLVGNRWESDGIGFAPKLKTEIATAGKATEKSFGFKLTDPTYIWDIVATPEVKAEAAFDIVLFKDEFTWGPILLGPLNFNVGTLVLGAHAGAPDTLTYGGGQYVEKGCGEVLAKLRMSAVTTPANPGAVCADAPPEGTGVGVTTTTSGTTTTWGTKRNGVGVAATPGTKTVATVATRQARGTKVGGKLGGKVAGSRATGAKAGGAKGAKP